MQKFWINEKTRLCRITIGAEYEEQAKADGFHEVSAEEQCAFRSVTRKALANGWTADSKKPFEDFIS